MVKAVSTRPLEMPPEKLFRGYELKKKAATAMRKERAALNFDELEDPASRLTSDEKYLENNKIYNQEVKRRKSEDNGLTSAVVLDAFGGIGAGLIVLKKLGIAMSKVRFVNF